MVDFFFAGSAPWFTVPAAIGTLFFVVRLCLMLLGSDGDLHLDAGGGDGGGGLGGHGPADHHADSDNTFKVLSIQSVTAFLMGFGWAGLGGLRGSGWGIPQSIAVGIVGGIAMVWLLGWLMKAVYDLQSHGNIDIASLVGLEGEVYVTIPGGAKESPGRLGRVRVVVDERQRFYSALSTGPEIPRNARVRVIEVTGDRALVVQPL